MTWTYENKLYDPTDLDLEEWMGFVYVITEKATDLKYVGKKLFWKKKILPVTKSRMRRKHTTVISDWRDYYGSSIKLKLILEEKTADAFDRKIIRLCKTRGECSYYEAKLQFDLDVLLRDDYLNGIINCRINAKHLKGLHHGGTN